MSVKSHENTGVYILDTGGSKIFGKGGAQMEFKIQSQLPKLRSALQEVLRPQSYSSCKYTYWKPEVIGLLE